MKLNFKVAFPKEKERPFFTKGGPFQRRLHETGPRSSDELVSKSGILSLCAHVCGNVGFTQSLISLSDMKKTIETIEM